jgi:hypothetical protein
MRPSLAGTWLLWNRQLITGQHRVLSVGSSAARRAGKAWLRPRKRSAPYSSRLWYLYRLCLAS